MSLIVARSVCPRNIGASVDGIERRRALAFAKTSDQTASTSSAETYSRRAFASSISEIAASTSILRVLALSKLGVAIFCPLSVISEIYYSLDFLEDQGAIFLLILKVILPRFLSSCFY